MTTTHPPSRHTEAIDGGPYDSVRNSLNELDVASQRREMKVVAGQPGVQKLVPTLETARDRIHVVLVRRGVGFRA